MLMKKKWSEDLVWLTSHGDRPLAHNKAELRELLKQPIKEIVVDKSCLDPQLISQLTQNGIKVYAFNVVKPVDLYRAIHWGIHGIVTPKADEMRSLAKKGLTEVNAAQLNRWIDKEEATLIDVRSLHDYEVEHLPNAYLMPLDSFIAEHIVVPVEKKPVFYCQVGSRSVHAAKEFLAARGIPSYHLKGGLDEWKKLGLPTIR